LLALHLVFTKELGIPYQAQFAVWYFYYSWLLQENGISICNSGNDEVNNPSRSRVWNHGPSPFRSDTPNHYAIDDCNFLSVKLIQYEIENLSLTTGPWATSLT
jgi:hypothetical protein